MEGQDAHRRPARASFRLLWPSGTPRPSKAGHAQGQFWSDSPIRGVREPPDTRIHLPPPPPVQVRDLVQLLVLSTAHNARAARPVSRHTTITAGLRLAHLGTISI